MEKIMEAPYKVINWTVIWSTNFTSEYQPQKTKDTN